MQKNKNIVIIYIFWFAVVFYLDPGGFFRYHFDKVMFGLPIQFLLYIVMALSFYIQYGINRNSILKKRYTNKYIKIISIWLVYYLLITCIFQSNHFTKWHWLITHNQRMIFQTFLVIPVIYFASDGLNIFIKVLTWSTGVILTLVIISLLTGADLVPLDEASRGFINASRHILYGYGIMYFLIPVLLVIVIGKYRTDKGVIISGILVVVMIFLSISRRDIIGIFEYILIILFIFYRIEKTKVSWFFNKVFNRRIYFIVALFLMTMIIAFPSYLQNATTAVIESINVMQTGQTSTGNVDVRMTLTGKVGIYEAIKDNWFLGTGYDPVWSTGGGGENQWEGSDYIFLASFAMYGLLGLIVFLPFYILAIKVIKKVIRIIKLNQKIIYANMMYFQSSVIVSIAASAEFIKNIIEYPNWFYPIGAIAYSPKYYIYLGLLIGSYLSIINKLELIKSSKYV